MTDHTQAEKKSNGKWSQKIWSYSRFFMLEPFFFLFTLSWNLNDGIINNFLVEKACRLNFQYNKTICDTALKTDKSDLDCDDWDFVYPFPTDTDALNDTNSVTVTEELLSVDEEFGTEFVFNYTVCKAQRESTLLTTDIFEIRALAAVIMQIIVLVVLGTWADRYNKLKPCLILPVVGRALSFAFILVSAFYFTEIPMIFSAYLVGILPAVVGGYSLCYVASVSYLMKSTPASERFLRLVIFDIACNVPFLIQYNIVTWFSSYLSTIFCQLIAAFYIIFVIKEVEKVCTENSASLDGMQNSAEYQTTASSQNDNFELTLRSTDLEIHNPPETLIQPAKLPLWRQLIDSTLLKDFVKFPIIRRDDKQRLLLALILIAYLISYGAYFGEFEPFDDYVENQLNWNGSDIKLYINYAKGLELLGALLAGFVLSNIFKLSDSIIGMLGSLSLIISSFPYAYFTDTKAFIICAYVEMFLAVRLIALRTIGASIVAENELTKLYSVMQISEHIADYLFPLLYDAVYNATLNTFASAFFLLSDIFYAPSFLVLVLCYIHLHRRKTTTKKAARNNVENAISNSEADFNNENMSSCSSLNETATLEKRIVGRRSSITEPSSSDVKSLDKKAESSYDTFELTKKTYDEVRKQTALLEKIYKEDVKKTALIEKFVNDNAELKNAMLNF